MTSFPKETETAAFSNTFLIFQPCLCDHKSSHALGFSVLLCFFFLCFIRFVILQSCHQDWLMQCTHIAHLTAMFPNMAELLRKQMGQVNQWTLRTLDYFCLNKLPQL